MGGLVAAGSFLVWAFGIKPRTPTFGFFPVLSVLVALACAVLFYLGKRLPANRPIVATAPATPQLQLSTPDTRVTDSDPQLEIRVADLRGITMSDDPKEQACFDLINRGKQSSANFACIEDFNIGGYRVVFRHFPPPIPPLGNHESITPFYINKPDGKLSNHTIFTIFAAAWGDLHNPKLYEYSIPLRATYQDDFRNLFEVRCDLIFHPFEHANRCIGQKGGPVVLETKNNTIRKVAARLSAVNWGD